MSPPIITPTTTHSPAGNSACTMETMGDTIPEETMPEDSQRSVEIDLEEPVRDAPVQGWGTNQAEIGAVDLLLANRMAWYEGRGHHVKQSDSRLNFPSQFRS
jgi:hypothetical protein